MTERKSLATVDASPVMNSTPCMNGTPSSEILVAFSKDAGSVEKKLCHAMC